VDHLSMVCGAARDPRTIVAKTLSELAEDGSMDRRWAGALEPVAPRIAAMGDFLRAETAAGRAYLPLGQNVLRSFRHPLDAVRVLIVGQDPYPTPGHPIGLSFAVEKNVRPLPRSLQNIYKELKSDCGIDPPTHGDLAGWAENGVMLLNRVLTVQSGISGSHRNKGWEQITEHAIRTLVSREKPLVAILWGRDALTLRPMLEDTPIISSAHPSPLSANRGFFGSRPFSRTNELLAECGADPVDWSLTD
jgi:uracil-DNA glycosylase